MASSDHLFYYCPLATSGIDWISSLLNLASPLAPPLSLRFNADGLLVVPKVFSYMLLVLKVCICRQRNDFKFRNVHPGAVGLLSSLKARLRFYLPLFFKCFLSARRQRLFFRQWCGSGTICKIQNGKLVFSI